jgi:hypothetical protein
VSPVAAETVFTLSMPEFELLVSRLPGFGLAPTGDPALTETLTDRGMLVADTTFEPTSADWSRSVTPELLAGLVLQATPALQISASVSTASASTAVTVAVVPAGASLLTISRRAAGAAGAGAGTGLDAGAAAAQALDDEVSIVTVPLDEVVERVMSMLPDAPSEAPFESTTQSLAASQAVVEAMQTGDGQLVGAVMRELGLTDSVGVLRDLAGPLTAQFSVGWRAAGVEVGRHDWVLGPRGWVLIELGLPAGVTPTPESVIEQASVSVTRVSPDLVRAEILGIMATWTESP